MKPPIVHTEAASGVMSSKQALFDELFHLYSKKVYGFAKSYHLCHQDAEEVVQDVFVTLWGIIDQIDTSQSVHSYIITVTKNIILNFLRGKAVRQKYIVDCVSSRERREKVENIYYFNELIARLDAVVDSLPAQRQKIFKMIFFEGNTSDSVSAKLHLSKRTVEHHLYMANKFVRKALSDFSG